MSEVLRATAVQMAQLYCGSGSQCPDNTARSFAPNSIVSPQSTFPTRERQTVSSSSEGFSFLERRHGASVVADNSSLRQRTLMPRSTASTDTSLSKPSVGGKELVYHFLSGGGGGGGVTSGRGGGGGRTMQELATPFDLSSTAAEGMLRPRRAPPGAPLYQETPSRLRVEHAAPAVIDERRFVGLSTASSVTATDARNVTQGLTQLGSEATHTGVGSMVKSTDGIIDQLRRQIALMSAVPSHSISPSMPPDSEALKRIAQPLTGSQQSFAVSAPVQSDLSFQSTAKASRTPSVQPASQLYRPTHPDDTPPPPQKSAAVDDDGLISPMTAERHAEEDTHRRPSPSCEPSPSLAENAPIPTPSNHSLAGSRSGSSALFTAPLTANNEPQQQQRGDNSKIESAIDQRLHDMEQRMVAHQNTFVKANAVQSLEVDKARRSCDHLEFRMTELDAELSSQLLSLEERVRSRMTTQKKLREDTASQLTSLMRNEAQRLPMDVRKEVAAHCSAVGDAAALVGDHEGAQIRLEGMLTSLLQFQTQSDLKYASIAKVAQEAITEARERIAAASYVAHALTLTGNPEHRTELDLSGHSGPTLVSSSPVGGRDAQKRPAIGKDSVASMHKMIQQFMFQARAQLTTLRNDRIAFEEHFIHRIAEVALQQR